MTRAERIGFIVIPLLLLISTVLHIYLPAESDKGWLLHAARMMLEGNRLYVNIIEINPPLIVWIYEIPVWFSMHIKGLQDFEALAIIGLFFSLLSAWLGALLIRRHPGFEGDRYKQLKFGVLLVLIFIFYNTQPYFFDREHIFLVMCFPYILRFMPALSRQNLPRWLEVLIGCMAAVGFCIKPHTIIVFTALALFAVLREQSLKALFRLENFIIIGAGILYMISIWHFTPEYFRDIVPMALATYSDFGNKNNGYIYLPPAIISIGLVFADFRPWYVTPYRRDVYYFLWLCFSLLLYALSNNGWGYTYNPFFCIILLISAWMLWEYQWLNREHELRSLAVRRFQFGIRGCVIVMALQAAYMLIYITIMAANLTSIRNPCEGDADCWHNGPYVQYVHDHNVRTFGTISFDFSNWITVMRLTGAEWETRFNHLWMFPRLLRGSDEFIAEHYNIVTFVGKGLADDMNRNKPEIMLVDSSPGFLGHVRHFDLIRILDGVPEFKEAWRPYHYVATVGICPKSADIIASECTFDVFRRTP